MSATDAHTLTLPGEPVTRSLTWGQVRAWLAANGWEMANRFASRCNDVDRDNETWQRKSGETVIICDADGPVSMGHVVARVARIDRVSGGTMLARIAGAPTPGSSPLPALLASARDVATGKIAHTFAGWCPGPSDSDRGMDRRDPNCAACKVALALDEALDGRVLAASGRTDERAAFLRESLAATVADCARLRSDLAAETETRQALRAQEDTICGMLADAADVPTDQIAGVAMLLKQRDALAAERSAAIGMIRTLLASARPNPKEHPTMTRAWKAAEELLGVFASVKP